MKIKLLILVVILSTQSLFMQETGKKYLIINADDFGLSNSLNSATKELLLNGNITSASLMVPAPWFEDALQFCKDNPQISVGVHLTLNSEWKGYKWGPVTKNQDLASLTDQNGYFYSTTRETFEKASIEEIRVELTNQIERVLKAGVKIDHLDNHMFSLDQNDFLKVAIELSKKYNIPFRLSESMLKSYERWVPKEVLNERRFYTNMAKENSIPVLTKLIPTSWPMIPGQGYEEYLEEVKYVIDSAVPGINEILIHPAVESSELKAIVPDSWEKRVWEYKVFKEPLIIKYLEEKNIILTTWGEYNKLYSREVE